MITKARCKQNYNDKKTHEDKIRNIIPSDELRGLQKNRFLFMVTMRCEWQQSVAMAISLHSDHSYKRLSGAMRSLKVIVTRLQRDRHVVLDKFEYNCRGQRSISFDGRSATLAAVTNSAREQAVINMWKNCM